MVVQAMKQETFTDIEYSFRKKKTGIVKKSAVKKSPKNDKR